MAGRRLARVEHRCSVIVMQLRALTLFLVACLGACGGGGAGKIMADTKVPTPEDPNAVLVPYVPPDISELTGIEEEEEDAGEAGKTAAPPASPPAVVPAPEPKP
jgi:hypothetical protein